MRKVFQKISLERVDRFKRKPRYVAISFESEALLPSSVNAVLSEIGAGVIHLMLAKFGSL